MDNKEVNYVRGEKGQFTKGTSGRKKGSLNKYRRHKSVHDLGDFLIDFISVVIKTLDTHGISTQELENLIIDRKLHRSLPNDPISRAALRDEYLVSLLKNKGINNPSKEQIEEMRLSVKIKRLTNEKQRKIKSSRGHDGTL